MVRIVVKQGDGKEFLHDCLSTSAIEDIASEIIRISNLQSKIDRLSLQLEPRLIPLDGNSNAPSTSNSLLRALAEAKSYASKDQVLHNRPLSYHVLRDHLQAIEKEFTENYQFLGYSDSAEFHQLLMGMELLQEDKTKLCWAGKELVRSRRLCDYIGKNEKTKESLPTKRRCDFCLLLLESYFSHPMVKWAYEQNPFLTYVVLFGPPAQFE